MKLYILTRNDNVDYDEFDSFAVLAESELEARQLVTEDEIRDCPSEEMKYDYTGYDWTDTIKVDCVEVDLRIAKAQILLGSFNAG